ncbi:MAG: 8-amino-7-oxononanoate synthase [Candidatus Margulisiibacteriota bacterium]
MALEFIQQELESLKRSGLYRELKTIEKVDGSKITISGKEYLLFCSNNYLGLAQHPKVIEKSIEIIKEFGVGAGASRLISGNTIIHEELEARIAKFKNREAALVFPTGYMANLGAITSLVDENDTVIIDRLNHASIIDACRLSKAKLQVYPHKDMKALEKIFKKSDKFKKRLIVTDHVFSMDGDIALLAEIVELAKEHDSMTMVDEAHAVGLDSNKDIDIVMGTLSKAFGSLGGYIAGSRELIDYLRNKARSFIYTTGLPPAACAAALAALDIIESQPELIRNLRMNSRFLRDKLSIPGGEDTPIIPIIIGDTDRTMAISQKLFERGIFASGIRPPTVPKGSARLRITVTANHSKEDLNCLASSLQELIQK